MFTFHRCHHSSSMETSDKYDCHFKYLTFFANSNFPIIAMPSCQVKITVGSVLSTYGLKNTFHQICNIVKNHEHSCSLVIIIQSTWFTADALVQFNTTPNAITTLTWTTSKYLSLQLQRQFWMPNIDRKTTHCAPMMPYDIRSELSLFR